MKRLAVVMALGVVADARAQEGVVAEDATRIEDVSLEELLGTPVGVASIKPATLRDSPGIITVVTREEIRASGARDLLDVLALVPGFQPATDVGGVVGVGFRGIWGHEGKILLLVDGQEMNETLYSTLQFGNHFPVEHIQRIEIIRGPGSAIYGGYAELAVINVITLGADDLQGVSVDASYGQMTDTFQRRRVSACFGDTAFGDLKVSLCGMVGQGNRSDRTVTDFYGNTWEMEDDQALDPLFVNLGVEWGRTRFRFLFDGYSTTQKDAYGEAKPDDDTSNFHGLYASLDHTLKLGDMTLTPRVYYKRQQPWRVLDKTAEDFYDKTADRMGGQLTWAWDATTGIDLAAGVETFLDHAELNDPEIIGGQTQFGTANSVEYVNFAAFAQVAWDSPFVNISAGARYEHNSAVGGSFVPRIALTRVFGRLHAKALFSTAFRAPGIENLNYAVDGTLDPERTRIFELEAGYAFGDHIFAVVNGFDMTIDDPIVYFYDDATGTEGYTNFDATGTRGAELDLRFKYPRWSANVGYGFYTAAGKNEVDLYDTDDDALLLGFPAHKLSALATARLWRGLSITPSAILTSETKGYLAGDGAGGATLDSVGAQLIANVFVAYEDLVLDGLTVRGGVHNLFDAEQVYVQAYNGGHAPIPAPSRTFSVMVSFARQL